MTTYIKETALYDTGAIGSDIADAATTATSYLTDISGGGVTVHPSGDSTTGVQITDDVDILRSGTSVINIGTDDAVRVGVETGKHVDVTDDGLRIYDGDTQVASFEENLVEIGTDPMLSAGMASSVVSMTGGSFQITSSINPLGGGRRTTVEVVGDSGREQYLSFKDSLSYIDLRSLGTSELGAAEFIAGVRSVDEAGAAFARCFTDGTASKTKIKGDSIEMDGPVTASSSVSATSFSGAGSSLTGLNGSNISSGTVAAARIANLPASKITSGTFGASRLPLATLDSQGAMSAEMYRRVYHIDVGSGTTPVLTVRTPNDNGAQWQMGINPTSGAVNVRAYNGSAWSAWKTIATVSWS